MRVFRANLRAVMKNAGISVSELGRRMGIAQSQASAMMNAESSCTLRTAELAAEAVGVPLHQLLRPAAKRRAG